MKRALYLFHILNKQGKPVKATLLTWARWFEKHRVLKCTEITKKIKVSTIFIGVGDERFETMIFGGECNRYRFCHDTMKMAMQQHRAAVEMATPKKKAKRK